MPIFSIRPRKPMLWLALAAVLGILLAEWVRLSVPLLLGFTLVVGLVALFRPRPGLALLFCGLVFASLHTVRHCENPAWQLAAALQEMPQPAQAAGIVWSEPAAFVDGRGQPRATFWLRLETFAKDGQPSPLRGLCLLRWMGSAPAYGDRVSVTGAARSLEGPRNPGEFDIANWLRRQGVYFELRTGSPTHCAITGHGAGNPLWHFSMAARAHIQEQLALGLPEDSEANDLIQSMILGLRGDTPPELRELFQRTGTLHLFAVSGLNVAMLAGTVIFLLKPFSLGRRWAAVLIVPLLLIYAVVAGLGASCVRASIMGALLLLGPLLERQPIPLNSMAAAGFGILAWDTNQLFSPGFQLSFVLVAILFFVATPLHERLTRSAEPDAFIPQRLWTRRQRLWLFCWRYCMAGVAVSVAAWVGSLVFMAGYFHLISWSAIATNLVAVPLANLILALGLLSLLGGLVSSWLAVIFNHASWGCAKALIWVVTQFARLPGGHVYVEWPGVRPTPVCEVTVLDAEDGAANHLRAGASDWLLDCGSQRFYQHSLLPYLRSRGVDQLDGLILTHGDGAHLGGALGVFQDFAPGWIADSTAQDRSPLHRALHAHLAEQKFGRRFYVRGDQLALAPGVELRVLFPPPGLQRPVADDRALVCLLSAAGRRILFTSDAGFFTEQWLLENEPDLRADVLVKGWREHDFSGTPDFLARVAPQAVICSAQSFGTPPALLDEWARPLRDKGIMVFAQHESGAVRVRILADSNIEITPWK